MREFKVGDKVILKRMTLEEFDECDTGAGMLSSMLLHVGKVHTVSKIPESGNPRLISPDGFDYFYSPNWLEPVRVFKGNK